MTHPDLEKLLNFQMPFAKQILEEGDFFPFGASLTLDQKINLAVVSPIEKSDDQTSQIANMTRTYHVLAQKGEIIAAGICCSGRFCKAGQKTKSDSIFIIMEHTTGQSIVVVQSYSKGWFNKYKYAALSTSPKVPTIFTDK
jgi:hypothetical protein